LDNWFDTKTEEEILAELQNPKNEGILDLLNDFYVIFSYIL
jgi:hypothetical protein